MGRLKTDGFDRALVEKVPGAAHKGHYVTWFIAIQVHLIVSFDAPSGFGLSVCPAGNVRCSMDIKRVVLCCVVLNGEYLSMILCEFAF